MLLDGQDNILLAGGNRQGGIKIVMGSVFLPPLPSVNRLFDFDLEGKQFFSKILRYSTAVLCPFQAIDFTAEKETIGRKRFA